MRLLVLDRGHDADLRVAPAHAFDLSLFAQARAFAVGGYQQFGGGRAALCPLHLNGEGRRGEASDTVRGK